MTSIIALLVGIVPFIVVLFFLSKSQRRLGVLERENSNLKRKNEWLDKQLETEFQLSEKRAHQIKSLLATGKFTHIELPKDSPSDNSKSTTIVQGDGWKKIKGQKDS